MCVVSPTSSVAKSENEAPLVLRGAFTLVELLIVIAVIGILIGVMTPMLRLAKGKGRDAACLANHRQFAVAYGLYAIDYDNFPVAGGADATIGKQRFSWGGVYWYDGVPGYVPSQWLRERPINKYLQARGKQTVRAEIFQCPSDDSMRYTASDDRVIWEDVGDDTHAEEGAVSVFAVTGNSYNSNDWCYVDPQSMFGVGANDRYFRTDIGPDDVIASPSRFILVCDAGQWSAGRFPREQRLLFNKVYGWWHGYEIGNMTFLDGSARREQMGDVTTPTYTFYSNPSVQSIGGKRMAWGGT
jgi:prepilin-type N-terminal cleavage/methylation domain-containing protein